MSVPVAARSKSYVYGCSPAEIVGSNPTRCMDVCYECCVFSGRGLCDELITRPEESYRLCCVVVGGLETSWMRRPWPPGVLTCPPPKLSIINRFLLGVNLGTWLRRGNVFDSKLLSRVFEPRREEVAGGWRKPHIEAGANLGLGRLGSCLGR